MLTRAQNLEVNHRVLLTRSESSLSYSMQIFLLNRVMMVGFNDVCRPFNSGKQSGFNNKGNKGKGKGRAY